MMTEGCGCGEHDDYDKKPKVKVKVSEDRASRFVDDEPLKESRSHGRFTDDELPQDLATVLPKIAPLKSKGPGYIEVRSNPNFYDELMPALEDLGYEFIDITRSGNPDTINTESKKLKEKCKDGWVEVWSKEVGYVKISTCEDYKVFYYFPVIHGDG